MATPSVSNLFPAIAQSFAIILIGYIFGFFKIIPVNEARSIGVLVGKLALPALLFKNLAILNVAAISWPFLGSILLSKFLVFVGVVIVTVLVSRPFNIGKGGILGIFVTQSNDFALGLPIVQALYQTAESAGQFDYASYIYLLAPVSLAIINPIGFTFMEFHKQSSKGKFRMKQIPMILLRTLKGVVLNPVIFMTVLGLLVNIIVTFGLHKTEPEDKLPSWLIGFLDILGGAYAACALFNIGIFMVGKIRKITMNIIFVGILLTVAKTILLPIVAYRIVYSIMPDGVVASNTTQEDISTFGFLLGTFPTAPTVFIFASQYNIAMQVVAASLVLCTFLSAPIMYISARMVLIHYASEDQYHTIISDVQRGVCILSAISVVCVFILFILARRYRSYVHIFVMHLMVAVLLEVVGIQLEGYVSDKKLIYWAYFWFSVFFIGVLSTRTWMAATSIGLVIYLLKGPTIAEKAWVPIMLAAWGAPVIITVLLVSICTANQQRLHRALVDVSFLFGEAQLVISLAVLVICFLITTICTVMIILIARKMRKASSPKREASPQEPSSASTNDVKLKRARLSPSVGQRSPNTPVPFTINSDTRKVEENPNSTDSKTKIVYEDSAKTASLDLSDETKHNEYSPLLGSRTNRNRREISPDEPSSLQFGDFTEGMGLWYRDAAGKHMIRFVILLVLLVFSSLVGILIVIWKILSKQITGIFIAINVLDTITNFGQGAFILLMFVFEKHWFWTVIYKKLRTVFFKIETVILPPDQDLDINVVTLCSTFKMKYRDQCKEDILSNKRFFFWTYESVFTGAELVDWLVEQEVVTTREEGVDYAHSLMLGRVLAHVAEEHYFHDSSYFYRFI